MAGRKTTRSSSIDWRRFSAGWRLIPDALTDLDLAATSHTLDLSSGILVDVIRPKDLVALTFIAHNLELIKVDRSDLQANAGRKRFPYLQAIAGRKGLLVVQLAYQHLGERALYEGLAPVPEEKPPVGPAGPPTKDEPATPIDLEPARPTPPIEALPSRGSRIVLHIPPGKQIPFSTVGLLEAIERFSMVVHPLATPRPSRVIVTTAGPTYHLANGLVANAGPDGLVFSAADRTPATPNAATPAGLSAIHRNLRRVREILTNETGYAVELGDAQTRTPLITEGLVINDPPLTLRPKATFSRDAQPLETAIEAPYRLVVSPSALGGWTHATRPVGAENAADCVELWHSRLGTRHNPTSEDAGHVDERSGQQRIVRAVWARDRERFPKWKNPGTSPISFDSPQHDDMPFRMSLDGADRHMLVRQSAETWFDSKNDKPIPPSPVGVEKLWLSSLGAWLDLHGVWNTNPYSKAGLPSILDWDHVAPMGRDQYVRVAYPGYLYPFGHRATLVKLTERKMKDVSPSIAGLYQRKFLVVGEPLRRYSLLKLPFQEVRLAPRVTPTLSPDPGTAQDSFFFPFVDNQPFNFILHCVDREGRKVRLLAPLMWVAEHYKGEVQFAEVQNAYLGKLPGANLVAADGQDIAFAPISKGGDTALPTAWLRFNGIAKLGTSVPSLDEATVTIKVAEQLAPIGQQTIAYDDSVYLKHGFDRPANAGEVWAKLTGPIPKLEFGDSNAPSDRAGGFIAPNLPIAGLSRSKGAVGDIASTASGQFNPAAFFGTTVPKLFGIVPLIDLLSTVGVNLDDAPDVISETLNRIDSFTSDLEQARVAVEDAVADTQQRLARAQSNAAILVAEGRQALADELKTNAQASLKAATDLQGKLIPAIEAVIAGIASVLEATEADVAVALNAPLAMLDTTAADMRIAAGRLPPFTATRLRQLADVLSQIATDADIVHEIFQYVNGLATSAIEGRFRYQWRPKLVTDHPILEVPERGLVLFADGRVAGKSPPRVEVLAELRDFTLNLLPGETLVRFRFDHISFKAGTTGKTEVDVMMNDIQFVGLLGFVETLKELIPFDGFADPPYVDVDRSGVVAGFTLALPNVSIGVFSLSNISLGADVQVPFLGNAVTVGFNFCTRERPFTLAVMAIGGGGWFGIRLSPDGLDVLELGLEAGACLSVNFGVASGSVSAMIGVYMRLEGNAGSLTAYFRLRGEVNVLGLISASIELYLALMYEFASGKLVGRASISVKVEVFFLSFSVTIACERRFAGSNGDPTFAQIMGVQPDDLSAPAWSDYCLAFSGV